MSNKEEHGDLDRQIRALQKEIGELSALLALKKMESAHPKLEKLLEQLAYARGMVRKETDKVESMGKRYLDELSLGRSLSVLGRVLLLGSIGYAVLAALGIFQDRRH